VEGVVDLNDKKEKLDTSLTVDFETDGVLDYVLRPLLTLYFSLLTRLFGF
jgi:hypothetical protein